MEFGIVCVVLSPLWIQGMTALKFLRKLLQDTDHQVHS